MKKILLFIIFLFLLTIGYSENEIKSESTKSTITITLTGKVSDILTNENLVGVQVYILGTNIKTYTDIDGNFSLENLPIDAYSIVVSYISYKSSICEIKNEQQKFLEIKLINY
jgi:hypothetical protein